MLQSTDKRSQGRNFRMELEAEAMEKICVMARFRVSLRSASFLT